MLSVHTGIRAVTSTWAFVACISSQRVVRLPPGTQAQEGDKEPMAKLLVWSLTDDVRFPHGSHPLPVVGPQEREGRDVAQEHAVLQLLRLRVIPLRRCEREELALSLCYALPVLLQLVLACVEKVNAYILYVML